MGPIRSSKSFKKSAPLSEPQPSDWWPHFAQRFQGSLKDSTDSQCFESMFKMSTKTFSYICSLVKEEMMVKCANFTDIDGNLFSPYDMVAIALRRLGSGESQQSIGNSFNVKKMTVARLTKRFVDALNVHALHHLSWPSTEAEMEDLKYQFEKIGGIPNCCGAIDTTHILMTVVSTDPSKKMWFDREKNQTMTLQAIVGPDLRFLNITAGSPGCLTDERILKSSSFFELCNKGERLNGKQRVLSEGNKIEEYIVGNSGFPLLKWLLTPYQGRRLRASEVKFNETLFRTHKVANEAFVKLKENWKIIKGVLWRPNKDRLPMIILACCILHNILIDEEDEVQERLVFSNFHDLAYRPLFCDSGDDQNGSLLRDKIAAHLSTA